MAAKLVSIEDAKAVISPTPDATQDGKIEAAIERVTLRLESLLNTSFLRASRTDRFFLEEHLRQVPLANRSIPLELSAGELVNGTVVIKTHFLVEDLDADGTLITQPYPAEVKNKEGLIVLFLNDSIEVIRAVVQVQYDSGFVLTGGVYENVPDYLTTICLAMIERVFSCADKKKNSAHLPSFMFQMYEPHIRFFSLSAKPLAA